MEDKLRDEVLMRRCLSLARLGCYYVAPNPMVGAILTDRDGRVVGEGWHRLYGSHHAEVECINDAIESGFSDFPGSTLYVSLEPCIHYGKTPPCVDLILRYGIGHVVVGTLDPNPLVSGLGVKKLRENGVQVSIGVLEEACREVNKRFICFHEKHRPYIILKWAQSCDGYIDLKRDYPDGDNVSHPVRLSTPITKHIVHKMRAENMSILIGSNTALLDNPLLLTRKWPGRHPIRILLDRRRRVPCNANIFSDHVQTIVFDNDTEWNHILDNLFKRNIHSVLVEGGYRVLSHILSTDIWDEIHVEVSSMMLHSGVVAPQVPRGECSVEKIDGNLQYTYYNRG